MTSALLQWSHYRRYPTYVVVVIFSPFFDTPWAIWLLPRKILLAAFLVAHLGCFTSSLPMVAFSSGALRALSGTVFCAARGCASGLFLSQFFSSGLPEVLLVCDQVQEFLCHFLKI